MRWRRRNKSFRLQVTGNSKTHSFHVLVSFVVGRLGLSICWESSWFEPPPFLPPPAQPLWMMLHTISQWASLSTAFLHSNGDRGVGILPSTTTRTIIHLHWTTSSSRPQPIDPASWPDKFPAKSHCSKCGLCETSYMTHVVDACNIDCLEATVMVGHEIHMIWFGRRE